MPREGAFHISLPENEQNFEVTWEYTRTYRYTQTISAENMDDAEALAENEWNDGHILARPAFEVNQGEWKLEGISVKREVSRLRG
jgi:hypothetical protein